MQYKIKEIREKKGISQSRLTELSGVSRATIIALENNEEHEAMVGTLKSLAKALGVPVSCLFADGVDADITVDITGDSVEHIEKISNAYDVTKFVTTDAEHLKKLQRSREYVFNDDTDDELFGIPIALKV